MPVLPDYGRMTHEDDFRLRAKARKTSSRGAEVNIPTNYKGFFQEARIGLVRGKAVSGRRTLTKPAHPAQDGSTPEVEAVPPWSAA